MAEVAELTKKPSWTAGQWYNFACVYSFASAKIADKKNEYADRAMELLQKAVKAGWNDAKHTANDTDLDPLRDREDFKKLLADLEKKAWPNPRKSRERTSLGLQRSAGEDRRPSACQASMSSTARWPTTAPTITTGTDTPDV